MSDRQRFGYVNQVSALAISQSLLCVLCHIAAPPECLDEWFACNEYKWNHTYCIPVHQRCDKLDDCIDKSDESGCGKDENLYFPYYNIGHEIF